MSELEGKLNLKNLEKAKCEADCSLLGQKGDGHKLVSNNHNRGERRGRNILIQILFDFIKFYLILNLDVRRFLTPIVLLRWRSAASRMGRGQQQSEVGGTVLPL